MVTEAYFEKATYVETNLGGFLFPAHNNFLKTEVLAARASLKFGATSEVSRKVSDVFRAKRIDLHEVKIEYIDTPEKATVLVKGKIKDRFGSVEGFNLDFEVETPYLTVFEEPPIEGPMALQ